ncbi:MAG: hypothetical protein KGI06_01070 [Candidatus Micrarchaeota archaeon]|nr:hypothetical protein [Candidatus Micrarchaeota archaeon]
MELKALKLDSLIMKRASSISKLDEFLPVIKKLNGNKKFVQIFDTGSIINKAHLAGAYANAFLAFKSKTNKSGSMAIEMLLFAGMTDQIDRAIELCGAKSSSDFIIFSNSIVLYSRIVPALKSIHEFKPGQDHLKKTIKKYKIEFTGKKNLDTAILERIAISRLSSD